MLAHRLSAVSAARQDATFNSLVACGHKEMLEAAYMAQSFQRYEASIKGNQVTRKTRYEAPRKVYHFNKKRYEDSMYLRRGRTEPLVFIGGNIKSVPRLK